MPHASSFRLVLVLLAVGFPTGSGAQTAESPVILRFGGDCLLAGYYEAAAADSPGVAFSGFGLFQTDDLSMVNLESPVTTNGTAIPKPYNFRTHPRFLAVLRDAGIDLVNIANNHIFDYGETGLFETITFLDSLGIAHVGAGKSQQDAHRPHLAVIRGKRIAFFGYYQGGEAPAADADRPGVAERSLRLIARDIRTARRNHTADFVIVSFHWGVEKDSVPRPWQRRFAHAVIDAGADAVIGHHPHVLQGIERYHGRVIAYSLGNLIFGGNSRRTHDTAVLELRLTRGRVEYAVIPVRVTDWRASVLSGTDGERVVEHVRALSRILHGTILIQKEQQ